MFRDIHAERPHNSIDRISGMKLFGNSLYTEGVEGGLGWKIMTEVTLNKQSFLTTLETIKTKFELAGPSLVLETEADGTRFALTAKRRDAPDVRAFGPCQVNGSPVSIACDISELEAAIMNAHSDAKEESLTLLIGEGIWVKDPNSATVDL